ncbi:MAG: hypothetical protein RML40_07985 [Bacteroidota bacterium]|nr:hypothetical protein [Bacteroidota bacterium]
MNTISAEALLAQRRGGSSFGGSRSFSSSSRSFSSSSYSSRPSSSFGGSRSYSSSYSTPSKSYSSSPASSFGGSRSYSSPSYSSRSSSGLPRSYGIPRRPGAPVYSYKPSSPSVGYNRSSTMIPRNYTYYDRDVALRRNNYYSGIGFTPPSYIAYTSPSYGMFSTLFLLSALSNLHAQQNALFFYNHWNTPSMMAYRQDLQIAAQKDSAAAQRLRELEAKVAELERERGGIRDTTYMPPGVDSAVVLSNDALGVQDDNSSDEQSTATSASTSSNNGNGSGLLWFILIVGGIGLWWIVRRRNKQRAQRYGSGSFS